MGTTLFASSGADYLLLDLAADSMALGGAVTAGLGSLSDLRHNPAGLTKLTGLTGTFTHVNAFGDWNHDWLAAAYPSSLGVFAIEACSSQLNPFPYYDDNGNVSGSINAGSQVLGLAWAHDLISHQLSFGSTLRFFDSNLAGFSNWGYAGDLGLRWQTRSDFFSTGLALKNFGEQTTYYIEREALPTSLDLGFCIRNPYENITLSLWGDGRAYEDASRPPELKIGFKVSLLERLDLSSAWRMQGARSFMCFGASFGFVFGKVSYAYLPDPLLSATHAITLQLNSVP